MTRTAAAVPADERLPKNTAASASHPRPLDILGTNDESLIERMHPAAEAYAAAVHHDKVRYHDILMPRDESTSASLPVMRRYSPGFVS